MFKKARMPRKKKRIYKYRRNSKTTFTDARLIPRCNISYQTLFWGVLGPSKAVSFYFMDLRLQNGIRVMASRRFASVMEICSGLKFERWIKHHF